MNMDVKRFSHDDPETDVTACCPDWSTDDMVLLDINTHPDEGEFATIYCPHCEMWQFVDVVHEGNPEPRRLTVDEVLKILPEGWTLVSEEHFKRVVDQKNRNHTEMLEKQIEIRYRAGVMVEVAAMLAGCGGYDHKTKNEVILRAIETLLQYRNPDTMFTRNMNAGDIPF
jgi:hypothetical protein